MNSRPGARGLLLQSAGGLGASVAGTALHYGMLAFLMRQWGFGPLAASSCGAAAGAVIIYLLNYFLVFRSTEGHLGAIARFLLVAAAGLVLNGAVLSAALDHLGWTLGPAQVLATVAQFLAGFSLNRLWTF